MNIVTFETAKRLKEAGFPQPIPKSGQFWYMPDETMAVVLCMNQIGVANCAQIDEWNDIFGRSFRGFEECAFAPAVTDFLPPGCFLAREISYKTSAGERWVIYDCETMQVLNPDHPDSDNAAEVSAAAWLALNEQNAK